MAGEGKKREKFHTHRAGKLDQENLYTGAAHLYPPLYRSYPPPSKKISFIGGNIDQVLLSVIPVILLPTYPVAQSSHRPLGIAMSHPEREYFNS